MNLLKERNERVAKTIRREEVDKVPFMFIADGYIPYYVGLKKTDITSFEKVVEISNTVYEDLQFDTSLISYQPNNLLYSPLLKIMGGGAHVVSEDFTRQINPKSTMIMEQEEYPQLINDPVNYMLETILPRRFELLRSTNSEEKANKILQSLEEMQKIPKFMKLLAESGHPLLINNAYFNPVDLIFDFFRNFTGIMRDVKKCPELVRDAGLALVDGYKSIIKLSKPDDHKALVCFMHLPAFLSPKDFEKTYWPSFKALTENIVEEGHNVCLYFEKNYEHLYDYLQELPKKGVIGVFEEDDLKLTKKKLGNTMAIAGGLSTNLLQHGTEQECIDHVKSLIDELGPGGGYFIAPCRPMMFSVDGRPENLKAVADCINSY